MGRRRSLVMLAMLALGGASCHRGGGPGEGAAASASASGSAAAIGSVGPATQGLNAVPVVQPSDKPLLGITAFVATVYAEPRDTSRKLGYLRVGAKVARSAEPAGKAGCPGGWYGVHPHGFVCAGEEATTDLDAPILRAAERRPDLTAQLPYRYGFVRAVLPLYLRVPSVDKQIESEFKLDEHLAWHKANADADKVILGAWDVPIDARGVPIPGKRPGEVGAGRASTELSLGELFGGRGDNDPAPFWLEGGKRAIPNIADFRVPEYAAFADRARRHTGLALVGSFSGGEAAGNRRFAVTTDLRLAPTSKLKPDTGSPFHGVELSDPGLTLPLAFVRAKGAKGYRIEGATAQPGDELEWRGAYALSGKVKTVAGVKYYRTKDKRWLHEQDVGVALPPASWPEAADKGEKWIEVSIENQTLVLWEGKRPVYATLVSTGRDGMKDPKTTLSTIRGVFRIRNKHVTATMDSNESSAVGGRANTSAVAKAEPDDGPSPRAGSHSDRPAKAPAKPKKASDPKKLEPKAKGASPAKAKDPKAKPKDAKPKASAEPPKEYVPKRGDGEYGVTKRRGEGTFQLRDVPYIQYFESGYALHGAYWHDVFGTPRSHGCINLSPVDAHRVFLWTEPAVPDGWHAMNTGPELGEGTVVIVHE